MKDMLKEYIRSGKIHFKTKKNRHGTATHLNSYILLENGSKLYLNNIFGVITGCRILKSGDISIKGSGFNAVQHLLSHAWYIITGEEAYNFSYERD